MNKLQDEVVQLTADEEEELSVALDEIRRGHFVDGWQLLAELKESSGGL
ncbi:MAG TPA: hypothetical protein VMU84_00575 [Thermoanaerobaculia bacterium]|nr:hypothetical protein [Thermoanaerobaculia bacterium]